MRPLELTVYPKDPTYEPSDSFTVYLLGDGKKECAGTSCALPSKKRLTDAELAAELHRSHSLEIAADSDPFSYKPGAHERASLEMETLWRFATLPHYDEVPE